MLDGLITIHAMSHRIRFVWRGKENGLQILQSINQGPFELGTTRNTLGTTPEGGVLLGLERPRTFEDLSDTKKKRYNADVRATNNVLQGLPKDIYKLINHNIEAKAIWDNVKMLLAGSELTKEDRESQLYDEFERFKMLPGENINEYYVRFHKLVNDMRNIKMIMPNIQLNSKFNQNQRYLAWGNGTAGNRGAHNRAGNANAGQGKLVKCYNYNGVGHIARNCTQPKRPQNYDYFKDKMLLMQSQENGVVLYEEELLFLADECDTFDSDVDDEPTAQSIFMANLSSVGSANPQAGPSNESILSEVHILENVIDHSNSNVIPYEQYFSVNNISVVPSCASSALNNACVSPVNDAFVPHDLIATKLKIYKEQVAIYEQRAKFELTEREQRMDDQMRMLIQNRNKTKENLKKELHSVKLQLNLTMENNKIIEETVTTLKQEFKYKESKLLTGFSNLKHLNDKLENKLHSQDNSFKLQAKKAQPALYDGDELLKPHHVPVIVPSSEEELELAEATRNKLHVKMNDSACVEKRVNITPPNYSKENFMATFTPQTQLTPEQVFWSLDLAKRKAEELKANAPPLPVLPPATVYPPNTPVHLVPRTLPTTSQVNIGLYVITQLFWDFEKTCKKRITPTGITEGERGFEQTKWCYLTEVIPFFNLLKEHFEGIQKSLVTEVRAMKAVFENLEAEVDQNEIDLLSGEIERKNLLITNENLIAECLSKDVFYTATDSVLNVSRFSDMHDAFTIAQKRIADLESKNFNLRNKIQNDDHDSMIKHFSKLEVEHFNLQLKYQNLKECFGNKKPVTSSDAPSFDSLFVIGKLNEQIQSRGNTIRELKEKISRLTEKNSDADPTLDLKALVSQNKDLTAKLNALHDLNERFRAENAKVKQHYKEFKPKVLAPGRYPIDVEPIPLRLKKNREVHLHCIKHLKKNIETLREIVEEAKVERPLDTSLTSGFALHSTLSGAVTIL
ncbi:hypothetical protein Tco_0630685 [Tanacetum coccineum]